MAPTWGRSPKGERCLGYAPAGHRCTTTFVCALSTDGLLAPLVLDGPINGPAFVAWVEQFLAPALRCVTCPRTARTSTPLNRCLPSSRLCCAAPRPAHSRRCEVPSVNCSTGFLLMSASATFAIAAIASQGEAALGLCRKTQAKYASDAIGASVISYYLYSKINPEAGAPVPPPALCRSRCPAPPRPRAAPMPRPGPRHCRRPARGR